MRLPKKTLIATGTVILLIFILSYNQWQFVNDEANAAMLLEKGDLSGAVAIYTKMAKSRYMSTRMESKTFLQDNIEFYHRFGSAAKILAERNFNDRDYANAVKNYELYLICGKKKSELEGKDFTDIEAAIKLAKALAYTGEPLLALKVLPAGGTKDTKLFREQLIILSSGMECYKSALESLKKEDWRYALELLSQAKQMISEAVKIDVELNTSYQPLLLRIEKEIQHTAGLQTGGTQASGEGEQNPGRD